jgi:uncharacterized membrane protein YfcA
LMFAGRGGSTHETVHQYQGAAMIVNFLLIAPAVLRHRKARAIVPDVWMWLAPAALVGIVVGVAASRLNVFVKDGARMMRTVFGAFLVYVAFYNVLKLRAKSSGEPVLVRSTDLSWWKKVLIGLPMGFSAGLLGIGGGALAVPALQVFARLPLRNAIATSAATILSIAWLGAIVKNASLTSPDTVGRSIALAAVLAPTAMIGSYLGGHLTHTLPLRIVRIAFIALMLLAAGKMLAPVG